MPGARHDCRAAAEHSIPDALARAGVTAYANSAYHGLGPTIRAPFRKVRYDRATGRFVSRPLSRGTKAANRAHPALRAPGERANTDPKNWQILRKVRSSPTDATLLTNAIQAIMLNS